MAGAAVLGLSSCGFLGIGPWHGDAMDETRQSFETWDAAGPLSIEEMIVSSQFGRPGARDTDAVVIGRVVDVGPGQSFSWTITDDSEERSILPFGHPEAEASSFHLSVEVTDVVVSGRGSDIEPGRIEVGVMHAAELQDSVADDYTGIGEVVFFLHQGSPLFDHAEDTWAIDYNQALIGRVSGDGEVDFPLVDVASQPDTLTVDDLRDWAADA